MKNKILDWAFSIGLLNFGCFLLIQTTIVRDQISDSTINYCLLVGLYIAMTGIYFLPVNDQLSEYKK